MIHQSSGVPPCSMSALPFSEWSRRSLGQCLNKPALQRVDDILSFHVQCACVPRRPVQYPIRSSWCTCPADTAMNANVRGRFQAVNGASLMPCAGSAQCNPDAMKISACPAQSQRVRDAKSTCSVRLYLPFGPPPAWCPVHVVCVQMPHRAVPEADDPPVSIHVIQ